MRNCTSFTDTVQGGRGHWAVYYTSPQSFKITLSHALAQQLLGVLLNWFMKLSVQTFLPLILIYRRGNFEYHYWECTFIYRPLSRSFRCLTKSLVGA